MTEKDAILTALRDALPRLRQRWPVATLALFGSVVRDEAASDRDLDVLVEFANPITLSDFLALEAELSRLSGRRVDLVSSAALKPYIGQHIQREAVLV
jgi:predicted nucleotidyltransferase